VSRRASTRPASASPRRRKGATDALALRRELLRWYDRVRRDLPWRRTRDPYAIWISEVMLQQTTVATVVPYWQRFLVSFPDLRALAAAPLDEVLRSWSGLGYYRRARHLHAAAREIVARRGGKLPSSAVELEELPGIGPYTAAAIASIAFGEPAPVIDGNVVRVLARLTRQPGDPDRAPAKRALATLARELIDPGRPADFNQALMELGATLCTPRAPRCPACPWRDACAARAAGDPERFPVSAARRETVALLRGSVLVRDGRGRVLLRRIPEGELNARLWEFPSATVAHGAGDPPSRLTDLVAILAPRLAAALRREAGLAVTLGQPLGMIRHAITHRRITLVLFDASLRGSARAPRSGPRWRWIEPEVLDEEGLTGAARKLARFALRPATSARSRRS